MKLGLMETETSMRLDGKVAFVTGSSREIAPQMAAAGTGVPDNDMKTGRLAWSPI